MHHTIIYSDKNDVIVFEPNGYTQSRSGHNNNQLKPMVLMNDPLINQITCGMDYSLIYRSNGELFFVRSNFNSELGLNNNKYQHESTIAMGKPFLLMNDPLISQICCGLSHSMIYKSNGELYVFGNNDRGQLGLGHYIHKNEPVLLMNDSLISQICCGGFHSIIYKSSGELFVFGANYCGQLGLGHFVIYQYKPVLLMNDSSIKQISCGTYNSMIYKSSGELLVFGDNECGQLGLGDNIRQNKPVLLMNDLSISQISCGTHHSMIYKSSGELLVFGSNSYGQLGLGHNISQHKPVLLMNDSSISQISCGRYHSIIYKSSGELLVFGFNKHGELGLGHNISTNKPVSLLLDNVASIKLIHGKGLNIWTPSDHIRCLQPFQQKILVFLKCLKRLQANTKLRVPKFVLFEIIKLVY